MIYLRSLILVNTFSTTVKTAGDLRLVRPIIAEGMAGGSRRLAATFPYYETSIRRAVLRSAHWVRALLYPLPICGWATSSFAFAIEIVGLGNRIKARCIFGQQIALCYRSRRGGRELPAIAVIAAIKLA